MIESDSITIPSVQRPMMVLYLWATEELKVKITYTGSELQTEKIGGALKTVNSSHYKYNYI